MSQSDDSRVLASGVDEEPVAANERQFQGWQYPLFYTLAVAYTVLHLASLNLYPIETWTFRIVHIAGALVLGFGFMSARGWGGGATSPGLPLWAKGLLVPATACIAWAGVGIGYTWFAFVSTGQVQPPQWAVAHLGPALAAGSILALLVSWFAPPSPERVAGADWLLLTAAVIVAAFLLYSLDNLALRMRAGTPFADPQNAWVATVGVGLIMELTRRVAGLALVAISGIFVLYGFVGPLLPGFLEHQGYAVDRFFTYIYTDNGILGPTTAVSSTYIILFITFAAFLQASKVGDYFVNFALPWPGGAPGGPPRGGGFGRGAWGC